jgi:hypothetical protein
MQNQAIHGPSDYSQSQPNDNGNGYHGRTPSEEATRKTPYDLREQVSLCNDADLTDFTKLLFCRLTDMAFKNEFRRGDGIVCVSKKFLAEDFHHCEDTIRRATRALEKSGFIWTKTQWQGSFEITWFFIREWADDSREYNGHTGANFGRRIQGVRRNSVRDGRGKFAVNPDSQRQKIIRAISAGWAGPGIGKAEDSPLTTQISGVHGRKSAVSPCSPAPCHGAAISGVTVQPSAVSPCSHQPCHRAAISRDTVQPSAVTPCSSQPCDGAAVSGLDTLKDVKQEGEGEPFKRSTGFNAQRGGRGARKNNAENLFLLDVEAMCRDWEKAGHKGYTKRELSGSGAWWRIAYRADADLMRRVLAEAHNAVKEGRVDTTPGQMAVDVWKRWGGALPEGAAA